MATAISTLNTPSTPTPRAKRREILAFVLQRDPLRMFTHLARNYGDVVQFPTRQVPVYLVSHPDDIREILVVQAGRTRKGIAATRMQTVLGQGLLTSEGELHKHQRKLIQPAFHRARVATYATAMTEATTALSERWRDGEQVDMAAEMNRLTLRIVGEALFGADLERNAAEVRHSLTAVMEQQRRMGFQPFGTVLARVPLPGNRQAAAARARLDATVSTLIAERRAHPTDGNDLLTELVQMSEEDETWATGGMSDEQVRNEVMTLLLAGHETTANALAWTWYLLSRNPEIEARLRLELDTVLAGRMPRMEDTARLDYTTRVVTESMRLYPPAWTVGRLCVEAIQLRDATLPAGSLAVMSQYVVHHDPRWFPEPERFDPDRWLPEHKDERPKFAYFPFGGGPRLCIGEPFAWMEAVLVLATLAQAWQARLVPSHPVSPEALVTLRPKHGLPMTLQRRSYRAS